MELVLFLFLALILPDTGFIMTALLRISSITFFKISITRFSNWFTVDRVATTVKQISNALKLYYLYVSYV